MAIEMDNVKKTYADLCNDGKIGIAVDADGKIAPAYSNDAKMRLVEAFCFDDPITAGEIITDSFLSWSREIVPSLVNARLGLASIDHSCATFYTLTMTQFNEDALQYILDNLDTRPLLRSHPDYDAEYAKNDFEEDCYE